MTSESSEIFLYLTLMSCSFRNQYFIINIINQQREGVGEFLFAEKREQKIGYGLSFDFHICIYSSKNEKKRFLVIKNTKINIDNIKFSIKRT